MNPKKQTAPKNDSDEFKQFDDLVKKVVSVSKEELKRREVEQQKDKAKRA